jgi:hypothetical protein
MTVTQIGKHKLEFYGIRNIMAVLPIGVWQPKKQLSKAVMIQYNIIKS